MSISIKQREQFVKHQHVPWRIRDEVPSIPVKEHQTLRLYPPLTSNCVQMIPSLSQADHTRPLLFRYRPC